MNTLSPQDSSEEVMRSPEAAGVLPSEVVPFPSAFDLIRQVFTFVRVHGGGLLSMLGVYLAGLFFPLCALGFVGLLAFYSGIIVPEVFPLLSVVVGALLLVFFIVWSAVTGNAVGYFVVKNGSVEGGARGAYRMGLRLLVPGAWISLLIMVSIFGGLMLFAVPGIFLLVVFPCTYSVFLAEGKRGVAALAQSWYYVKGRWWSVFALLLVWFLITWIVLIVVDMGVAFFASLFFGQKIGSAVKEIISGMLNFIVGGFAWIYYYYIYSALRALKPEPMTEQVEKNMRRRVYVAIAVGVFGIIVFISLVVFLASIASNIDNYYNP